MVVVKVWGSTECLLSLPTIQVHRIAFDKGGVCSKHYHKARYNAFYVLAGDLLVEREYGESLARGKALYRGDFLVIPPGVVHSFEALTDGEALEIYFAGEVSEHDIVRLSEGFMRS